MAGGGVVGFCGGRSVPPGCPLVAPVVAAVLRAGRSVAVGCSVGADAVVLSAVVAQGAVASCRVFAAFGPGGVGACSLSSVGPVLGFAASGGAVSWWAGGPVSVPLQARLVRRSQALVGSGLAGLVAFFSASSLSSDSPASPGGTLLACQRAASLGVPVVAFVVGAVGAPPSLGSGAWVPSSSGGAWSGSWRWQPSPVLPL